MLLCLRLKVVSFEEMADSWWIDEWMALDVVCVIHSHNPNPTYPRLCNPAEWMSPHTFFKRLHKMIHRSPYDDFL